MYSWLYNTLFRSCTIWLRVLYCCTLSRTLDCIVRFFEAVLSDSESCTAVRSLEAVHHCSRLTKGTSLKQTHCCCNCIIRFFEAVLSHLFLITEQYAFSKLYCYASVLLLLIVQYALSKLYCHVWFFFLRLYASSKLYCHSLSLVFIVR